ncbi:hypothetical protein [Blastococcus saxobsidens]|uniref:DUF4287 domain-containing protein n=1 Tax=Blastococcus saxobsidens (strain DD2) TaxID=1146883 RepID=H6RTJ9_BLASD|nr:hypothetical protein [Blastococcus saxobsidens]CCG01857.1 protein of unknown function [Blastococcus saxobsidens DD2]
MATNPRIAPVERATNRSWDEWLRFMDGIGAENLDHRAIALKVYEELDGTMEQAGWWTQSVTVAYEQHVGRRIPGQRSDGTFQLSVSRSTPLGMQDLMDRWQEFAAADEAVHGIVVDGEPRISGTDRRITWRTKARDGSSVVVTSEPKKNGTASLVVNQVGLATPELNDGARERWVAVVSRLLERA